MKGEIRRAQLIQTFGVGAIVDANGETFVVKDTKFWNARENIECSRLSRLIQGKKLKTFSGKANDEEAVPVERFPRWYYCPACNRMRKISKKEDKENEDAACPRCKNAQCKHKPEMIPMRFVAYCSNGHLAEINWWEWVHQKASAAENGQCKDKDSLKFTSGGRAGGDFLEMKVKCDKCGLENDLSDIQRQVARPNVVEGYGHSCCGRQPWQRFEDREACKAQMKIEPRGSSSIHRSLVLSALDIEEGVHSQLKSEISPEAKAAIEKKCQKLIEQYPGTTQFLQDKAIKRSEDIQEKLANIAEIFSDDEDVLVEYGFQFLLDEITASTPELQEAEDAQLELLDAEYALLAQGKDIEQPNFKVLFNDCFGDADPILSRVFSRIGQVKRLREVRAFKGFVRGEGKTELSPDLGGNQNWVPAIEAFGEGIYFEFNQDTLTAWLEKSGQQVRQALTKQLNALEKLQERVKIGVVEDPIFILAHTVAHILIRDLTFRSGYSSSALRERIFCVPDEKRAGILIYTTDTDTEGTLGGLVDQARPEIQSPLVRNLSNLTSWCSADPVCRETKESGFQGVNQAACHCCALVSETSCGHQNAGLNRLLLSGMGEKFGEPLGFLRFVEETAREDANVC